MKTSHPSLLPTSHGGTPVIEVDLDNVDAVLLARLLPQSPEQPRPQFLIDCGHLLCQRTLGVNHVVSQLLLLRKAGATIWLRNVNATLRRCLNLLQLGPLLHMAEPG